MAKIIDFETAYHLSQDELETDFATEILSENQELLERLSKSYSSYAEEGRSDKFYILTKAINVIMKMGQDNMKRTLGIDAASLN